MKPFHCFLKDWLSSVLYQFIQIISKFEFDFKWENENVLVIKGDKRQHRFKTTHPRNLTHFRLFCFGQQMWEIWTKVTKFNLNLTMKKTQSKILWLATQNIEKKKRWVVLISTSITGGFCCLDLSWSFYSSFWSFTQCSGQFTKKNQ